MSQHEHWRGILATVGQIVWWPVFWFLANFICRAKVQNNLILPDDPEARFIIAANHQSRLDPFVITGVLGPRFWWRLMPYRYIAANLYLYNWGYTWLLWPLGGFPAQQTKWEGWGLKRAKQILIASQTVCIFPEGQRSLPNEVQPKRGVAVLANMPNTYVIPIKLSWQLNPRRVKVIIGQAYSAHRHPPKKILDTIYGLT